MKNLALIIGSAKCGTTSLFHYLSQHPSIRPSKVKEVNFFSRHWDKGSQWYEEQFEGDGALCLDASPSYTRRPDFEGVAERVASLGWNVKFIYSVRHPIEHVRSRVNHRNAIESRGERITQPTLTPSADYLEDLLQYSRFAYQLEDYERLFPGQIHILTLNQLKSDPTDTLNNITDFLEIDRFAPSDTAVQNTISDLYARKWVKKIRRSPLGPLIKAAFPDRLRRAVVNAASDTPPEILISPEMERHILEAVEPDLHHLRANYGVDAMAL